MSYVRIPAKLVRAVLAFEPKAPAARVLLREALEAHEKKKSSAPRRKERALAASERKDKTRKLARRSRASSDTGAIYDAVTDRAAGTCEGCGQPFSPADPPELDHFWGRAKAPQSVQNCWLLHRCCHRAKTQNWPSAASWLLRFARHAERHGYRVERGHALSRVDGLVAMRSGRGGA